MHSWKLPDLPSDDDLKGNPKLIGYGSTQAKLLKNGHLMVGHGGTEALKGSERPPSGKPSGSSMVALKELDWGGKIVWEYKNEWMHHDFEPLPNGNVAVIEWEKLAPGFVARIQGGIAGSEFYGNMYSDAIREVDRSGRTVWSWSLKDHLNPDDPINSIPPGYQRNVWTNLDNIVYVEKNPINDKPAYLASVNYLDSIILIDQESGKILWRWGMGVLGGQHSVDLTVNDTVITFDTGAYRPHFEASRGIRPGTYTVPFPRVLEIDLKSGGRTLHDFSQNPFILSRAVFQTPINGGAEALSNGNILVSAGIRGRVFEISGKTHKVVWDFINPFGFSSDEWPTVVENSLYSAFRYPKDYTPQFKDLELE